MMQAASMQRTEICTEAKSYVFLQLNQGCTEYSIRILFRLNSRPNSVFVFGQIILLKVDRIRIVIHFQ